jgi:hypothetical protein
MAGPERALPDGAGHGRLRASHADRDGVISTLKSAYVLGFVTKDEFDVRVGQVLTARIYAELAVVTADLPAWLAAAQPPGRAAAQGSAPIRAALRPAERAVAACALFAAVAFAAAFVSDDGWLALAAVGSALASLIVVAVQVGAARRGRQPGGRLPGPGTGAGSRAVAAGLAAESPRAIRHGRAGHARPAGGRRAHPLLSS